MKKIYYIVILTTLVLFMIGTRVYHLYQEEGYKYFQPNAPVCLDTTTEVSYWEEGKNIDLLDVDGNVLIETSYNKIIRQNDKYFTFEHLGKVGLFTRDCEVILDAEYDDITSIKIGDQEAYTIYVEVDGTFYVLNSNGELGTSGYDLLDDAEFRYLNGFYFNPEDRDINYDYLGYKVLKDGLYGLIDKYGEIIIPLEYDFFEIYSYYDSTYTVKKDGKTAIIDSENNILLPFADQTVDRLKYFDQSTNKWGMLSSLGEPITEPIYQDIEYEYEFILLKKDNLWGVAVSETEMLIDYTYISISYRNFEEVFIVENDSGFGIINLEGNLLVPHEYSSILGFSHHSVYKTEIMYRATKGQYVGIINLRNEVIIPFEYTSIDNSFWVGVNHITATKDGKYGVIDFENNVLIPFIYDEMDCGYVGKCKVGENDGLYEYIDVIYP